MLEYYTVSWSLHCQRAEEVLTDAGLAFTKIDLSDRAVFAAAARDLGFHRLPVLVGKDVFCEGLAQISKFVNHTNI